MTNKTSTVIQSVRDELRERRAARAEYRAMKAALAAYTSPAEINDLLAAAEAQDQDTETVRNILASNMQHYYTTTHGVVPGLRYSA